MISWHFCPQGHQTPGWIYTSAVHLSSIAKLVLNVSSVCFNTIKRCKLILAYLPTCQLFVLTLFQSKGIPNFSILVEDQYFQMIVYVSVAGKQTCKRLHFVFILTVFFLFKKIILKPIIWKICLVLFKYSNKMSWRKFMHNNILTDFECKRL